MGRRSCAGVTISRRGPARWIRSRRWSLRRQYRIACLVSRGLIDQGIWINALENLVEVAPNGLLTLAGRLAQTVEVENEDRSAFAGDEPPLPESPDHAADIASADAEHDGELLLGQRNPVVGNPLGRRDQPLRRALLDRMRGVARNGLK